MFVLEACIFIFVSIYLYVCINVYCGTESYVLCNLHCSVHIYDARVPRNSNICIYIYI